MARSARVGITKITRALLNYDLIYKINISGFIKILDISEKINGREEMSIG